MNTDIQTVLNFKGKFLSFILDPQRKRVAEEKFDAIVKKIPSASLRKIAEYVSLYSNGVTDAEKIYFSAKAFDGLAPFFD